LARHQFAVIALAAIALASSFWQLLDLLGAAPQYAQAFGVAAFEKRFDEFRKTVQPHSVFGYLSDNAPNDPSARPEFYLTQYTLAPAIVKLSTNESWVVLNYHSTKQDTTLLPAHHLKLVQNFGNGVMLLQKAQP
jgi:hypothetical protein